MKYGYARVSTKGQQKNGNSLDEQRVRLLAEGADEVIEEAYTGTKTDRPKFSALIEKMQPGDTVIVTKLDRFARNTKQGLETIDKLLERGCKLNILNMGTFDNTPAGKLMRTIFLAFAEYERDMIVQRTQEGKEVAREKQGYHEGRNPKQIPDAEKFLQKQKDGSMTVSEICAELGISRSTWYAKVKEIA